MEIWDCIKSISCKFQTFDNYINDQSEVQQLKINNNNILFNPEQTIIAAKSGNGVTHLLQAICNKWIERGKKIFHTSSQSIIFILKKLKTELDLRKFQNHLLSFELLAIDNIQFFYKRSAKHSQFLFDLIMKCKQNQKALIMGCSEPEKDLTKSKKHLKTLSLKRIELKALSSINIFKILKNLCEHESLIPDKLLYMISGYNGSVKEYVNCLISIRFKSKADHLNIAPFSFEEIEEKFNIKKYFPKQQFRKCLDTCQLLMNYNKENPNEKIPINPIPLEGDFFSQ